MARPEGTAKKEKRINQVENEKTGDKLEHLVDGPVNRRHLYLGRERISNTMLDNSIGCDLN